MLPKTERPIAFAVVEQLHRIAAGTLRDLFRLAADALGDHAAGIDQLNIFPTANHDTGTNMARAFNAVATAVEELPERCDLTTMAAVITRLTAALPRGRSAALLHQLLGGFAEVMRNQDQLDALRFALALEAGSEQAARSVPRVVEGTMVTVAQVAATAALACADADGTLAQVTEAAASAALDALERTPGQIDVLGEAGVVDAGAAGWVVVLEVVAARVSGEEPTDPDDDEVDHSNDVPARYHVSMRVDCDDVGAGRLASVWSSLGERVEIVADEVEPAVVIASVATDDIGAVIEAALTVGRPRGISVRDTLQDRRG